MASEKQIQKDIEDGIRRAVAFATYESVWDWFSSYKSGEVIKYCIEKVGSKTELKYRTGVPPGSIHGYANGTTKITPKRYLKIIKEVFPERAKHIEAELRDIERLRD